MAIKTFTTGEVLTASDTNAYLANSGLTYVAGGAISGTSTNFQGCFSATYENYRIVASKINMANGGFFSYRMLNTATAYFDNTHYMASDNLSSANSPGTDVLSGASYNGMGYNFSAITDGGFSCVFDFFNPFGTGRTFYSGSSSSFYSVTPLFSSSTIGGGINVTTSFDGIQFFNANGGSIAGNVRIYGYRKA